METTKRAAKILSNALLMHCWDQNALSAACGLNRATVSMHLNCTRPIRDDHLAAYSAVLDAVEQSQLLAAWCQDTLPPAVLANVLDPTRGTIREEVRTFALGLTLEQQEMLRFWAEKIAVEDDLAAIFAAISRKAGHTGPTQRQPITYLPLKSPIAPGHAKAASPHHEP